MISFDDLNVNVDTSAIENSINLISNSVQSISDTLTWLIYESSQYTDSSMMVSDLVIIRSNTSALSSDFMNLTSTFSGGKYQINISDTKSDYDLGCLYNLTGGSYTVSSENSKYYSFGGLGLDLFSYSNNSNCTFEGHIKSFDCLTIDGSSNTYSNLKVDEFNNKNVRSFVGENVSIPFKSCSYMYRNRISNYGIISNCTLTSYNTITNFGSVNGNIIGSTWNNFTLTGLFNSNTLKGNIGLSIRDGSVESNSFSSTGDVNITGENISFAGNTLRYISTCQVAGNYNSNSISNVVYLYNSYKYFSKNTLSNITCMNLYNKMGVSSNSISSLRSCNLDAISVMKNTLIMTILDVNPLLYSSNVITGVKNNVNNVQNFVSNSLNIDELNIDFPITNPSFSKNSILVDTLSVNRFFSEYFTDNIINVGNFLDFNYGSSEVYDASLNYLLSDYIAETKVLGKYNLVPYVRSLNNSISSLNNSISSLSNSISTLTGGGGNAFVSICAHDSNINYEASLWPKNIDVLKLNLMNSEHNILWNGGNYSNGTISNLLVNNWDLSSISYGMYSALSFYNVLIKSMTYNRLSNTITNTGSLFSGNLYTINNLYYTHIDRTTNYNETSDSQVLIRNGIIHNLNLSFKTNGNLNGADLIFSDSVGKFNLSGVMPMNLIESCSISTFNYKDFTTTDGSSLIGACVNKCTIDALYFDPDRIYTNTRVFRQCSIKNANVVCTPLMWGMSSAQYRNLIADAISGMSNTTADVVPISYVSSWP